MKDLSYISRDRRYFAGVWLDGCCKNDLDGFKPIRSSEIEQGQMPIDAVVNEPRLMSMNVNECQCELSMHLW